MPEQMTWPQMAWPYPGVAIAFDGPQCLQLRAELVALPAEVPGHEQKPAVCLQLLSCVPVL